MALPADTPLPSSPSLDSRTISSKKAQILKLAATGRHSDREIAIKVGTSEGYVAKTKSEARRGAALQEYSSAPGSPLPSSIRRPTTYGAGGSSSSKTKLQIHRGNTAAPSSPLLNTKFQRGFHIININETEENAKVRKELWIKFDQKVPNVEIIKETGLNPDVVWSEFEYYLSFTNRDPYALQKQAMVYLSIRIGQVSSDIKEGEAAYSYQNFKEKHKAKDYLINREFFKLLALLVLMSFNFFVKGDNGYLVPEFNMRQNGIRNGTITGLDMRTGKIKWQFSTVSNSCSPLVINGSVFAAHRTDLGKPYPFNAFGLPFETKAQTIQHILCAIQRHRKKRSYGSLMSAHS